VKVIVGLGNPGKEYDRTPHNVGFEVVERLSERLDSPLRRSWRFKARTAKAAWSEKPVLLVQPLAYMNNSGSAVAPVLRSKGGQPGDLIVVLDDADLPLGRLRVRAQGGSGGHKGLASIIAAVGTQEFARVRIGIGRDREGDLVQHVLTPFSSEEQRQVQEGIGRAADAVLYVVEHGVEKAMNQFNS
jgi:peptidyl-tRNA hydrolase, PTH1 family